MPSSKGRVIYTTEELAFPIKVIAFEGNVYVVDYGKEATACFTYGETATQLGLSILHALGCEGKLDQ